MEQSSQLLVQLTDLLLEDLQVLQCHFQEPSVHGLELRARAERITQLFRRNPQPLMGQNGQRCGISLSVRDWIAPAPDATCRTSALRLLASLVLASSTFPVLPTGVSNIAPSTP